MYKNVLQILLLCLVSAFSSFAQGNQCCNSLINGDFEDGNTGFSSSLPNNCACVGTSYCVGTNFQVKCSGWQDVSDHTTGFGNFLIVDGHESASGPVDVWRSNVTINANVTYCFSFWVASQYTIPFDLGLAVNGTPVSGAVFTVQQSSAVWTQYNFTWTAGSSGTNISIQQLMAGSFQDFGIDDIEFGTAIAASFIFQPDISCGLKINFFNQSTGQAPLSYQWNFGDPASGAANISTQQNPMHRFSECGEFLVCLRVTRGNCVDSMCQVVLVEDIVPPTAVCAGASLELDANCSGVITPSMIDGGSFDDCQISGMSVSPFQITGCGTYPVTLTVRDLCGNESNCTALVQASESEPPMVFCPPSLFLQGSSNNFFGECILSLPAITVGASDNCGNVQITTFPVQGANLTAGSHQIVVTGKDDCGNEDTCHMTIVVYCESGACSCSPGGNTSSNLISNGTFTGGNTGFSSGIPQGCGVCMANTQCVYAEFTDKCPGWPADFFDHTYGLNHPLSQFLIIDGNSSSPADVWINNVAVTPGKTYCFSFWAASVYSQPFNLEVYMTDNNGNNQVLGTCPINQSAPGWAQYSFTWTCPSGFLGTTISIRQTSAGSQRDFGIDDICFREVCETDFTFQVFDCGLVQFTSQSTGPVPLQYCWDFDGIPGCESTLANPVWQFPTCGTYTVSLTISGNGCTATATHQVQITDNVPPNAQCVGGLSIIMNNNCEATLSVGDVNLGSTDNCGIQSMTISQSLFDKCDTYPVTLTVTDWCNLVSTCTANINVVELIPPVITSCAGNILTAGVITPLGTCAAEVFLSQLPVTTDNCSQIVQVSNDAPLDNIYAQGITTVTWTAFDQCGNSSTCSSQVRVICDTCSCSGPAVANLIVNGNFSLGDVGFTSGLTQSNNCAAGFYDVDLNFNLFCSWNNLQDHSNVAPRNYLILDGSDNGPVPTDLWRSTATITPNTDYCFSFYWASAYTNQDFDFPVEVFVRQGSALPISLGQQIIDQTTTQWTKASFNWNSGNLSGPITIGIRQLTGDDHRDFGIDDICFVESGIGCSAQFTIQNNGCGKFTFTAPGNGFAPNYTWDFGDGSPTVSTTNPIVMHQFLNAGTYQVRLDVVDFNGCTATQTISVAVTALPSVTISPSPASVCSGSSITLTANGAGSFQWSPGGATTNSITVTPTTLNNTYAVQLTDNNGCTATASVTVQIKPVPAFILNDAIICEGESVVLAATGGGTYLWSPGGQPTASVTVSPTVTTTYTCVVTATNGCTGSNSATVTVQPTLLTNLVASFPFSSAADDISQTNIDGVVTGALPDVGHDGAINSAYLFNGLSDFIDCSANNRGVTNAVSVCAWVKTGEAQQSIWIAGQYSGAADHGYLLTIGDITNTQIGKASFSGRDGTNTYHNSGFSSSVVNDNNWHCIIGTAGAGGWKIYVDGVLQGNASVAPVQNLTPIANPFTIGIHSDPGLQQINPMYMDGVLDNVRVYNRELSLCDIEAICSTGFVGLDDLGALTPVRITPNPNSGEFQLDWPVPVTINSEIRVFDLAGRLLSNIQLEPGSTTKLVQLPNLDSGLYFVQLVSDNRLFAIEKFVKH